MISRQESINRLAASAFFGIVLGAAIGLAFAHFQGIPFKRPAFWWSESIGVMMFTIGLSSQVSSHRPEWRIWLILLFVVALGFIGLEIYTEPNLLSLFTKADPAVYDHVLFGIGLGGLLGFVMAKLSTRR